MAGLFMIASGAIGTIILALEAVTALFNDIQAIQNAPALITSLGGDLKAVQTVLQQFSPLTNLEALTTLRHETQLALWLAVQQCAQACHSFRVKVQKWTSRSTDGKMHWWVRASVGLFEVAEIGFLKDALVASKDTVNAALASAILLSAVQTAELTNEIEDDLTTQQAELTQLLQGLDERTANIDLQLASLRPETPAPADSYTRFISQDRNLATDTHGAHDVPESPHLVTDILAFFHHSKQLLKHLISDSSAVRAERGMENIHMEKGSKLLGGTIGTQEKQEISQDVKDVSAVQGGRGIVGVAENVDIK
ncbi:hypothetical protein BJY00DRAFT_307657 [Aspergillus carlsbadensis]|nr:hypothetical protein BJY00DRAFT_307657 [Aspergillus carlsbadensis]